MDISIGVLWWACPDLLLYSQGSHRTWWYPWTRIGFCSQPFEHSWADHNSLLLIANQRKYPLSCPPGVCRGGCTTRHGFQYLWGSRVHWQPWWFAPWWTGSASYLEGHSGPVWSRSGSCGLPWTTNPSAHSSCQLARTPNLLPRSWHIWALPFLQGCAVVNPWQSECTLIHSRVLPPQATQTTSHNRRDRFSVSEPLVISLWPSLLDNKHIQVQERSRCVTSPNWTPGF